MQWQGAMLAGRRVAESTYNTAVIESSVDRSSVRLELQLTVLRIRRMIIRIEKNYFIARQAIGSPIHVMSDIPCAPQEGLRYERLGHRSS